MNLKIDAKIRSRIKAALQEDLGKSGDITSLWTIPDQMHGKAEIISRTSGVVCGVTVVEKVFACLDKSVETDFSVSDGDRVKSEQVVATISGSMRSILAGERTALNYLTHLSGIASLTRRFVDLASPFGVSVLDTRKTTPLLRTLEKHAVVCGGGKNHRMGLYDMVLIKDNHIAAVGGVRQAIRAAKASRENEDIQIEVEVSTIQEARIAAEEGVDIILLDNMTPAIVRDAVEVIAGMAEVEVSGGITLENVHDYAITGIDRVSIGSLTHSVHALDMSLEIVQN
ncbi:MAG TPA: carboxylating nicotinate-nucleotide diphosphorylase [bacterium]|nr:carboxylating nicotinate-nucleotide diphosphorylase [bacterium]